MTDGAGAVAATYTYDAYGSSTGSTGSVTNPCRYAGEFLDSESGLSYLRARYYDPTMQQFLTQDTSRAELPYAYANGGPLNAVDPSGLSNSPAGSARRINPALRPL